MRKKIGIRDVRLGMYIEELCGSWMDHPFWRASFLLSDPADLKTLRECGIQEVWIDSERGLDVADEAVSVTETATRERVDETLSSLAMPAVPSSEIRVSFKEELVRAHQIQAQAKKAVTAMFQEVRMGKAIPSGEAAVLVEEISSSVTRNPAALLSLVRLKTKDDYTYLHSVAVCALMIALGRQVGVEGETLRSAGMAGLLHDVGKMAIPDAVLNKPGRLTDAEFDLVKSHPDAAGKSCSPPRSVTRLCWMSAATTTNAWTARAIRTGSPPATH